MKAAADRSSRGLRGFTLIEVMVVVGIIGLIAAMGVPTLYRMLHREGFSKTVGDVMELCSTARARAIMGGRTVVLVFYPQERRCQIGEGEAAPGGAAGAPSSVHFGDDVQIEMLDVNHFECKDDDLVQVRFFADGTSEEMTLILRSDQNEWRKISLELTTGLAFLDSDPHHWR
jgi:type II secretion system protein H